jgi:choice-of-anchor C domain-containing protein
MPRTDGIVGELCRCVLRKGLRVMRKLPLWVSATVTVASVAFLCCSGATPATAAGPNLLTNGSFETPVAGSPFQTVGSGNNFGGWSVDSGSIDVINGYWNAEDGNQSLDMSGLDPGTISQSVNTFAGQRYELSFWMAGNTDNGNQVKQLESLINGNVLAVSSFDTAGKSANNMGWQQYSYDFTAAGGPTTVSFTSLENNPYGPALDNVSVRAVPEASTVLLFALLVGGTVVLVRKRRPSAAA